MTRQVIPGAWYCEALPSGEYVALIPHDRVETHRGALPLPLGEPFGPRFVRCSNIGGFKFAGQADTSGAWEWREGDGWKPIAGICAGVSPVIYDRLGVLHISDGSIGSQGWRYVEDDGTPAGRLITGDQTYTREVAPGVLIHEYTDLGGLLIGQGHDGGVVVWDGVTLRLLEAGDGRFIRASAQGERVAIAFMSALGAVIYQATFAELRALLLLINNEQPPIPKQPKPTPKPESIPMPSQLDTIQTIRAKYPTPLGARHWEFLVEVCQATGAWLYRKDGGDHVYVPPLDRYVSLDVIGRGALGDVWVDILGDAEGQAVPAWDAHQGAAGEYLDPRGIALPGKAPVPPPPAPKPEPAPQPPAPAVDLTPIYTRLAALEAKLAAVEARPQPAPTRYRVVGSTSRVYGHSHGIDVRLEPIS